MLNFSKAFPSFSTDDLETTKDFYLNKLGISLVDEFEGGMMLQAKDLKFMIYIKENHEPASFTVLNFQVETVKQSVADLKEQGITFEQYPQMGTDADGISEMGDTKMAWFKDPSGNIIGIMELKS